MLELLIERGGYSRNRKKILSAVGISTAALSQYMKNQNKPSFDKLTALANFFDVSLDYLVYGEPITAAPDDSNVLSYLDQAMTSVRAQARQHADLVGRIGTMLAQQISTAANDVLESGSGNSEGLILMSELVRMELYCRRADVIPMNLVSNVIEIGEGEIAAGSFLTVVADNLRRGCVYRFLLPRDVAESQRSALGKFRELLGGAAGDFAHENCEFRESAVAIVNGAALYHLDTGKLEHENELLYSQFRRYVTEDGWLGYVMEPHEDFSVDMLMSRDRARRARTAFAQIWDDSDPI